MGVRNGVDNESVAVVALVIVTQPEINNITNGNTYKEEIIELDDEEEEDEEGSTDFELIIRDPKSN